MRHAAFPFVLSLCVVAAPAQVRTQPTLTVKNLEAALAANPHGDDGTGRGDAIRTAFGGRNALLRGLPPKIDELTVAWAIELAEPLPADAPQPAVVRDVGNMRYPMVRLGGTNVYALVRTLSNGTAFTWDYEAGGPRLRGLPAPGW